MKSVSRKKKYYTLFVLFSLLIPVFVILLGLMAPKFVFAAQKCECTGSGGVGGITGTALKLALSATDLSNIQNNINTQCSAFGGTPSDLTCTGAKIIITTEPACGTITKNFFYDAFNIPTNFRSAVNSATTVTISCVTAPDQNSPETNLDPIKNVVTQFAGAANQFLNSSSSGQAAAGSSGAPSGAPSSSSSAIAPTTTVISPPDVLLGLKQAGQAAYDKNPPTINIAATISGLVTTVMGLLGVVFFLLLLYAGVLYMTSAGDPEKVDKAKKLIASAIIGMIIVFSAYALASFVERVLKTPPRPTPYTGPQGVTTEDLTSDGLLEAIGDAAVGGDVDAVLNDLSNPNADCDRIRRNQGVLLESITSGEFNDPDQVETLASAQQALNSLNRAIAECNLNTSTRPQTTTPPPPQQIDVTCDPDIDPDCDEDDPNNNPEDIQTFIWD